MLGRNRTAGVFLFTTLSPSIFFNGFLFHESCGRTVSVRLWLFGAKNRDASRQDASRFCLFPVVVLYCGEASAACQHQFIHTRQQGQRVFVTAQLIAVYVIRAVVSAKGEIAIRK